MDAEEIKLFAGDIRAVKKAIDKANATNGHLHTELYVNLLFAILPFPEPQLGATWPTNMYVGAKLYMVIGGDKRYTL